MPGPRPTPTSILKLRGSWRAKKRGDEPTPPPAIPPRPDFLHGVGVDEWDRLSAELFELGVLTIFDMAVLAAFCANFARWTEAEAQVREMGAVVRSPNGFPVINPFLSVANEALRQMRTFAAELGITPASRGRVSVAKKPEPLNIAKRQRGEKSL